MMNVTIVGAGNVGTQLAVHCAESGMRVIIYSSKPNKLHRELKIINAEDEIIHRGIIDKVTNDPEDAFFQAELIIVTVPANLMSESAEIIEPYAHNRMKICLVPGTGGGECAFKKCMQRGATIFGVQRVPSVARLVEYGDTVRAVGYRDHMYVASLPSSKAEECAKIVQDIVGIKCSALPNYLNLTLTPSNPILHTTRLKVLFENYSDTKVYDRVPLFYEEWNDETSELLFACDDEVQQICSELKVFDLSYVKSLKVHYESDTVEGLTQKIKSIEGFRGLLSPMISTKDGFIVDWASRYFTADFPYGLLVLIEIADMLGLEVPNMRNVYSWYQRLNDEIQGFSFGRYGIHNMDDLISFYSL